MKKTFLYLLLALSIPFDLFAQNNHTSFGIAQNTERSSSNTNKFDSLDRSLLPKFWNKGNIFGDYNPQQEKIELRTGYSKKFELGDGTREVIIGGPFHFLDELGVWKEIDLRLQKRDDADFPLQCDQNIFTTLMGRTSYEGIKMGFEGHTLHYGINPEITCGNWKSAPQPSFVQIGSNPGIAEYPNLFEGANMEYEITTSSILHRLRFSNRSFFDGISSDADSIQITEQFYIPPGSQLFDSLGPISIDRLSVGNIYIVHLGDTLFTLMASRIWDSRAQPEQAGANNIILYRYLKSIGKYSFSITTIIPKEWLRSVERLYPVTFDPVAIPGSGYSNKSYAASGGNSFGYPWKPDFADKKSQSLYDQSDIGYSGKITDIAYLQACNNSLSNNGIQISMKETSSSSISSFTNTGWKTCYNGSANYTNGSTSCSSSCPTSLSFSGGTWRTISIPTSDQWNYSNSSNLLVEAIFNNSSNHSSNCSVGAWWYFTTSATSMVTDYKNNSAFSSIGSATVNVPIVKLTFGNTASCTNWKVSPSSFSVPATGGTYDAQVTATGACKYNLTFADPSWVHFDSYLSNGYFRFTVDKNQNATSRNSLIQINNVTDGINNEVQLYINQSGTTSCTKPTTPTLGAVSASSSTEIMVTWNNVGASKYTVFYGLSCGSALGSLNTSSTSATLTLLTPGTKYYVWVTAFKLCDSDASNCKSASTPTGPSIAIVSSIIPPWQRENDSFDGSVTVVTSNPSNAEWHLRIKIFNSSGSFVQDIDYPKITLNTQTFSSNDKELKFINHEGNRLEYHVVLESNHSTASISGALNEPMGVTNTKIIASKWEHRNYFLNDQDYEIRIPILYNRKNPVKYVSIVRSGNVSLNLSPLNIVPISLVPSAPYPYYPKNYFEVEKDGYCRITLNNSNLGKVQPGDFQVISFAESNGIEWPIESQFFDLTRYGRIYNNNTSDSKVVVLIGGIFNEMDATVKELRDTDASAVNSKESFSLVAHLNSLGFNCWYISQGNANYVARNGYDVGKALDLIYEEVKQYDPKINLICHSKGGLDCRSFLQNHTISYSGDGNFGEYNSKCRKALNKVVFLGTPHQGANLARALSGPANLLNCPGSLDLSTKSNILRILNSYKLTNENIKFLNLTGFVAEWDLTDDIVGVWSSENPESIENLIQVYQNDPRIFKPIWAPFHMEVHKNDILYREGRCTDKLENLNKIVYFLRDQKVSNCKRSGNILIKFTSVGSIIPNANIYIKPVYSDTFKLVGNTDENGTINITAFKEFVENATIWVCSPSVDTISFVCELPHSDTISTIIPMFHSNSNRDMVDSAVVRIKGQPVTLVDTVELYVGSRNSINYSINNPLNQDSFFTPLLKNHSGQIVLSLDTGRNDIIVRFNGVKDSVLVHKTVYYIPLAWKDTFLNTMTIIGGGKYPDYQVFVDDVGYGQNTSDTSQLLCFAGGASVKFSKIGYSDFIIRADSGTQIDLAEHFVPKVNIWPESIDFDLTQSGMMYWRNLTCKDSSQQGKIRVRQVEPGLDDIGVKPITRKFLFENLDTPNWSNLQVAGVLDQVKNFSKESVFMLSILDDSIYYKFLLRDTGMVVYDSAVQKFEYHNLNFGNGSSKTEALTIALKQPAIPLDTSLSLTLNEQRTVPYSSLYIDPDSIKGDIDYKILAAPIEGFHVTLTDSGVQIFTDPCYTGHGSFQLMATHDYISTTHTFNLFIPDLLPDIRIEGVPDFCMGDSMMLSASDQSNKLIYRWFRNDSSITNRYNSTLVIYTEGLYQLVVSDINQHCFDTSQVYRILNVGNDLAKDYCIMLYPVPSTEWLNIRTWTNKVECTASAIIISPSGIEMKSKIYKITEVGEHIELIDLTHLQNGTYWLKMSIDNDPPVFRPFIINR